MNNLKQVNVIYKPEMEPNNCHDNATVMTFDGDYNCVSGWLQLTNTGNGRTIISHSWNEDWSGNYIDFTKHINYNAENIYWLEPETSPYTIYNDYDNNNYNWMRQLTDEGEVL